MQDENANCEKIPSRAERRQRGNFLCENKNDHSFR